MDINRSSSSINPQRPYYTPGLHHQHNYTSLPSNDAIPGTTPDVFAGLETSNGRSVTRFSGAALLTYVMTILTNPFAVGTTLLQVQYSPHEDVEVFADAEMLSAAPFHKADHDFMSSDDEDEDDVDLYGSKRGTNPMSTSMSSLKSHRSATNKSFSVYDDENRPVYQMAPLDGGVLAILRQIIKQPTEGWKSLTKGQRAAWLHVLLRNMLQPAVERSLNDMFGLYDDTIPITHLDNVTANLSTLLVSNIFVGVALSPLEIVGTRLIVQSESAACRKYSGPIHAIRTMCREEGGLRNVYNSVNLVPTIIHYTIHPLLSCAIPLVINRVFFISQSDSPLLYSIAELAISTVGLVFMLPLETIRKRLHCQIHYNSLSKSQNSHLPFKTAVPLRPQPYRGMLDALYRIMKEEGTKVKRSTHRPLPRRKNKSSAFSETSSGSDDDADNQHRPKKRASAWGVRGLYKGFGMQMTANIMIFFFQTLNAMEDDF